jgi:Glyoxalase-like domain
MRCELDHLVVACTNLEQGCDWLTARLGVEPQGGGRHPLMGTHNRLLRLGARVYLEVIAIDPDAPAPGRPRWFDLDQPAMQARLAQAPALVAWAVRTDNIAEAVTKVPELGQVLAASRGALAWRITVPEDGTLQFGGMLPTVLQWGDAHPTDTMGASGCELIELALSHPMSAGLMPLYRALRIAGPVNLKAGPKQLLARVRTPAGDVDLA